MPNNTLYAYKALQMSYKSYYNQQEPLNENPFNQSKLAKMEKPKKTEKKNRKKNKKPKKKPVPNLKFAVAFGFFGLQPPPPPKLLCNLSSSPSSESLRSLFWLLGYLKVSSTGCRLSTL